MRQLNLNVTPEFERDLRRLMRQQGITKQSEAIRRAVHEAAAKGGAASQAADYRSWLGLGLSAALNPKPLDLTVHVPHAQPAALAEPERILQQQYRRSQGGCKDSFHDTI